MDAPLTALVDWLDAALPRPEAVPEILERAPNLTAADAYRIQAALMEREEPSLEAASVAGAILEGARALDDLDLELETVLVRAGTEVPAMLGLKSVAHHADVEPDLVICLPNPQFLGVMPTVDDVSFGMLLHNPGAIVPVRLLPN